MKKTIFLSVLSTVFLISVPLYLMLGVDINKSDVVENSVNLEDTNKTVIVVDIGHGGSDYGTINTDTKGTIYEKDINLEIGTKLIDKLNKLDGIKAIATRTDDVYVELRERAKLGNTENADIFISIHCNASEETNTWVDGIETFYYNTENNSKLLAEKVQSNLITSLNKTDRGVKTANYQVLRESDSVAILVECGFLTNYLEREQLSDDTYQDILTSAITQGILDYIGI